MEEWPLGMSCLCCSEAAETAVQKEDAPEQIGWTFATVFLGTSKKREFRGL